MFCVYLCNKPPLCANGCVFHLRSSNTASLCSLMKDSITVQLQSQVFFWNISLFRRTTEEITSLLFLSSLCFSDRGWVIIQSAVSLFFLMQKWNAASVCPLRLASCHVEFQWMTRAIFSYTLTDLSLPLKCNSDKLYKRAHTHTHTGDNSAMSITCHDLWSR